MRSTGRRSRLLGFCLSALIHAGTGAGLLWFLDHRAAEDGGEEHLVAVTLTMFELTGEIGQPPEPVIEPASEPTAEPEPAREPEPIKEPAPEPEPVREPEPDPEPRNQPQLQSQPDAKPEPEPRPKAKPEPKPEPKPKSEQSPRPEPKKKPTQAPALKSVAKPKPAGDAPAARSGSPGASSSAKAAKPVAGSKALEARYLSELRSAIARNRRYPERARRRGETGTAVVYFVIERNGRIGGARVDKGSGSSALDKAAVESVQRLGKFKPFPEGIGRGRWALRVPIQFSLE